MEATMKVIATFKGRSGNTYKITKSNGGAGYNQQELDDVVWKLMNNKRVINIEIKEA